METTTKPTFWQRIFGGKPAVTEKPLGLPDAPKPLPGTLLTLDLPPNDPLVAYFASQPGVVEVDKLNLDSAALRDLQAQGVKLVIPLVNQGELLGLMNLGQR